MGTRANTKALRQEGASQVCLEYATHWGRGQGEAGLAYQIMDLKLHFKCYDKPLESFKQGIMG